MSALVPAPVRLAARRGFLRTSAQSLSSAIPTTAIAVTLSGDWLLGVGLGVAGAVVTALAAGLASYLSILSRGIPEDYQDTAAIAASGVPVTDDEARLLRDLRLSEGRDVTTGAAPTPTEP